MYLLHSSFLIKGDLDMKDLMMFFGVTLGIRFTQKQKQVFFDEVNKIFSEQKRKITLQSKKSQINAVNNIVIGDLSSAKIIVTAAYDTPSKVYLPRYKYYPFDTKKNLQNENISLIIQFVISILVMEAIYYLLKGFTTYSTLLKIISVLITLICLVWIYFFMKAKPNKVNFSRNSAAVVLLIEVALKVNSDQIAFVLLDQSVMSYQGLFVLKEELKANQKLIYLDNFASGDILAIATKGNMDINELLSKEIITKQREFTIEQAQNSVLGIVDKMIYLVCGDIEKNRFVVKNSRCKKDFEINIPRLEKMATNLIEYLSEGEKK